MARRWTTLVRAAAQKTKGRLYDQSNVTAGVKACCDSLVVYNLANWNNRTTRQEARICCDIPEMQDKHQGFCSPWGPPMPPAMPAWA